MGWEETPKTKKKEKKKWEKKIGPSIDRRSKCHRPSILALRPEAYYLDQMKFFHQGRVPDSADTRFDGQRPPLTSMLLDLREGILMSSWYAAWVLNIVDLDPTANLTKWGKSFHRYLFLSAGLFHLRPIVDESFVHTCILLLHHSYTNWVICIHDERLTCTLRVKMKSLRNLSNVQSSKSPYLETPFLL